MQCMFLARLRYLDRFGFLIILIKISLKAHAAIELLLYVYGALMLYVEVHATQLIMTADKGLVMSTADRSNQ